MQVLSTGAMAMRQGMNRLDSAAQKISEGNLTEGIVASKSAKVQVAALAAAVKSDDEMMASLIELALA